MSSVVTMLRNLVYVFSRRNTVNSLRSLYSTCTPISKHTVIHRTRLSCPQNLVLLNRMMASTPEIKNIGIEEFKKYQDNKIATIIDVREVNEIKETGSIPGGINIPLGDVGVALQEDPDIFEQKYNHPKPSFDHPIIFSCRSGKRSLVASKQAQSLGYHKILNFAGGWIEWENNLPK